MAEPVLKFPPEQKGNPPAALPRAEGKPRRKRARAARDFVRYVYVAVCIQKASSADASLRDAVHTGFDVRGLILPPCDL